MPEIVNVDQAAAWDGAEGAQWVEREERQNEALGAHTARFLAAADVHPSNRVLDVGCGCGETTRACARSSVDGETLGVDLSNAMLERARLRATEEGLSNVTFEQGDAQVYPFAAEAFDVVASRFGSMFFADPVAAFANVRRATAPGGRLALIVWQETRHNEWLAATRDALAIGRDLPVPPVGTPGPFGLADAAQARSILESAGYSGVAVEGVELPFWFGPDADDAFAFARGIGLVRGLLEGLDPGDEARALDALLATITAHDTVDGVVFGSRVWIVTAFR